jgi:hypothetical protein
LRFLRWVILMDAILAGVVVLIGFFRLAHLEAYGTALLWMGLVVMFFSCFIGIGGFSARSGDAGA